MNTNSIGAFLAALRKANGLTQKQLADKLNVSDKAISRWERDECAPDLTLIPVLAELYGITSDEIIRGRRKDPDASLTTREEERSAKRLKHLLEKSEAAYLVRCVLSIMLAAFGLIVAVILNCAFSLSYAGFLCGCILFVAAGSCQLCFSILHKASLSSEDFDSSILSTHRLAIQKRNEQTYTVISILVASTIPLLFSGNAYWGLPVISWLFWGLVSAAAVFLLSLCICHIRHVRAGISHRIPCGHIWKKLPHLAFWVLTATILLNILSYSLLSRHFYLYSDSTRFDDLESFKTHMETPTAPSGAPLIFTGHSVNPNGETIRIFEDPSGDTYIFKPITIHETLHDGKGQVICEYYSYNMDVWNLFCSDTADKLPIYTQNSYQHAQWRQRLAQIMYLWIPIYGIEILLLTMYYLKKRKK